MSEELTGKAGVEASHGLTPAPIEPTPADPETFGPGIQGIKDAGNALTRERGSSETEPTERFLEWKSGEKRGQRVDLAEEGFSLTASTAAKTLSEAHRAEDFAQANENLQALAADVDATRAWVAGQQQPDAQQQPAQAEAPQPQQPDAPQPESTEQPSGVDPDFAALLERKPQLRAQLEAPFQQAEAARQAFAGATQQIADVALSSILANFPELQGVSGAELPTVLSFISKQDPVKAQAIQNQLQQVNAVYSAAQQAKAQQAQMEQAQLKSWAAQQGAAFDNAVKADGAETVEAVKREALSVVRDVYGLSHQDLKWAMDTSPAMHSAAFQRILYDAVRFRMAQKTAHQSPARTLPAVQRPGVSSGTAGRSNPDLSELRNEFRKATGNRQLELGARLTRLQRESRG